MGVEVYTNCCGFGWMIQENAKKYLDYFDEEEIENIQCEHHPFIHWLNEEQIFIGFLFADRKSSLVTMDYQDIQERLQESHANIDKWWDEYLGECSKPAEEPMFCIFSYYAY